ncbi:MAG: hypothetical protein WCZ19_02620 [Acholeplasma sp.]
MKQINHQINLKNTYVYALILFIIGIAIFSIWFLNLLVFFLIAGSVTIANYFLLERIQSYKSVNQMTVYATLALRYFIYVVVAFIMIWFNKESPILEYIGISLIAGFSIIQIATIINTLVHKGGGGA